MKKLSLPVKILGGLLLTGASLYALNYANTYRVYLKGKRLHPNDSNQTFAQYRLMAASQGLF